MKSSEKILKMMSQFLEKGILTSEDLRKEFSNNLKFQRENLIEKLELVTREEFNVLKKIVQKQEMKIKQLQKKKIKKAKRS
jgi:BMFP domain-containing protein YqiC|tara:strand:+ start:494 stop:736 length:243 start_codon:yes stop_codon:yes gene_type:complete